MTRLLSLNVVSSSQHLNSWRKITYFSIRLQSDCNFPDESLHVLLLKTSSTHLELDSDHRNNECAFGPNRRNTFRIENQNIESTSLETEQKETDGSIDVQDDEQKEEDEEDLESEED